MHPVSPSGHEGTNRLLPWARPPCAQSVPYLVAGAIGPVPGGEGRAVSGAEKRQEAVDLILAGLEVGDEAHQKLAFV